MKQRGIKDIASSQRPFFAEVKYQDQSLNAASNLADPDAMEESTSADSTDSLKWNLVDVTRPLLGDCELRFLTYQDHKNEL